MSEPGTATLTHSLDQFVSLENARWMCCQQPANSIAEPAQLGAASCEWITAHVPGTVASALRGTGRWNDQQPIDLDASDWWFRTSFEASDCETGVPRVLCFDGLAGLAQVWLNGECVLETNNMFRSYRVDVAARLGSHNELVIVFRSLAAELKQKRPRPGWKTNLITHQQLRWVRTSLLGRIPGWTPPLPAIGPWRAIRLEQGSVLLSEVQHRAALDGEQGVVSFSALVNTSDESLSAKLCVGKDEVELRLEERRLTGELRIANPARWWPHTHGEPHLSECRVIIRTKTGEQAFTLERIGFRALEVRSDPGFGLTINGEPVYCRGACWTTGDIFTHSGTIESLRHDLQLARDAGVNMIRIGGTMHYESDAFYRLCDELGILVWQDFMFANMDYPVDDPAFAENIAIEARQLLGRLAPHPSVVVYCGSSEIEQQAAMLGVPRELWRNRWFGEDLPALCAQHHPGTVYVPSSPSGGVLPFHAKDGITHYYGIGAYRRSLRELRQADVKFTTECLGFANPPEPEVIDEFMGGLLPVTHHPRWKQRVPRDTGSSWDFEDVRDHYLREWFNVDPTMQRSFDMPRYLELSRVVSGELMARTFGEWRSVNSNNAGALVWFFKDLWAASGWGVLDHRGLPKAAYYQLKRAWQTRQLTLTDEGLDGLQIHLVNETRNAINGVVEVQLLREPGHVIARHELPVSVAGRSKVSLSVDEIVGVFRDINYAYRFGPVSHHVVVATWFSADRTVLSEAFHFTRSRDPEPHPVTWQAQGEPLSDGRYQVVLQSEAFLHHVRCSAKGFLPDDNYFHLVPARAKTITFAPVKDHTGPFRATVEALNALGELTVNIKPMPH